MVRPPVPPGWAIVRGILVSPWQWQFMAAGVAQGLSANAIIRAMQGTPLRIRREVGLAVIRQIRGVQEAALPFSRIRREFRPSERLFSPVSRQMRSQYRAWGRVTYVNRQTGDRVEVPANIGFDQIPTRGEIEGRLVDITRQVQNQYYPEYEFEGVTVTGLQRRAI